MKRFTSFDIKRRRALRMLGAITLSPAALAADPPFPARQIRIVVPFGAASGTDFIARLLADKLSGQLNQSVIVENKPGAGGIIGTQQVARSAPDGYTLGIASLATLAMVPATQKEPPYDAIRDFAPLTSLVSVDMVLATSARVPANTLPEFVNWARSQKDTVFLGTLGAGTSGHFAGFLFGKSAGIKFEPVHYRSQSDAMTALITGDVHALVGTPSSLLPHVKSGRIRALASNGPTRMPAFADTPTFLEVGYPDMQFSNWIGMVAPAKTPVAILDLLHAEIVKATSLPQVRSTLEEGGYRIVVNKREELAAMIRNDVALWSGMVKTTGFKV